MHDRFNLTHMTLARRNRLWLASPFLAFGLLALFTPTDDGPTFCLFALCTGTACPGCGMTRAAAHLVRGDIGMALSYHPLVLVAVLAVAGGWGWFLLRLLGKAPPPSQKSMNLILIGSAAALLAVWAVRLATGTLPPV